MPMILRGGSRISKAQIEADKISQRMVSMGLYYGIFEYRKSIIGHIIPPDEIPKARILKRERKRRKQANKLKRTRSKKPRI